MLRDIIRFEWRYHTRQISFAAAVALFAVFGFALTATGFGPDNVNIDSPYSIAESIGLLSLLSVFVLAVFCANAVVRDRETGMEEIVFTTSVEKLPFLAGRFTGSFLAAFTAFSACTIGMFIARFMPWQDADRLGSANPLPYLWALLVIALPNLLFAGTLLFALSTVTRSVLASYAGSVVLYVLYFVAAAATNSPLMAASVPGANQNASLASLLDPFALSAFFEQTQNWLPAVRDTKLLELSGKFLLNRLLWIAASLAILAAVLRMFSFRVVSERAIGAAKSDEAGAGEDTRAPFLVETAHRPWLAYLSSTKLEIRSFILSIPFLAMTLLWAALAAFEILSDVGSGEYGSASYPSDGLILETIGTPLSIVGTILLIYIAAEIVWRERTLRVSEILHATPSPNTVFVASKCTALAAVIMVVTGTALLTGAIVQLARGWTPNPGLMLAFAYFLAAPLLLFAVAAFVVQTLVPHKYAGMIIVLFIAVASQGQLIGLQHPMLRFGSPPATPVYSAMNGFGRSAGFHWLMLYWGAMAALLLLFAIRSWRRDPAPNWRSAAALLTIFLGSGAFIFYNTNVLNAHQTNASLLEWKAAYEKRYRPLAGLAQPRIAAVTANVDLFPDESRYRIRGEYVLENRTAVPVGRILVAIRRDAKAAVLSMPSARVEHDERFGHYTFTLNEPLAPGATTTLRYDVTYAHPGFESGEPDYTIARNGSFIMTHRLFPTIGYRQSYEIEDTRERRVHGLPARSAEGTEAAEWARFDVTVTTAGDQRVVAPGRMVATEEREGRRTFRFLTGDPIPNHFIIASARYRVLRETHDGVAIEIYYHPEHGRNVARMMSAAAESTRLFSDAFGPYPYDYLRLAEVPAHFRGFAGYAAPSVIFFGENRGFLIDARDPERLDIVYRRVAHEVAHQWWGHNLVAVNQPGGTTLTESLTKYSELLALEKAYGSEAVRESLGYELDLYLSRRTGESTEEPPLSRAGNQDYLYYRKGAIVMYGLRNLLGEDAVNAALRNLLREHGGPGRKPSTAHLLEHLHAVAAPGQHALIDEWMNDVVLYDLAVQSAAARRRADGKYDVTMRLSASKSRGNEKPLPIHEMIDVGIFTADGKPLHLSKHAVRDGVQDLQITVAGEPSEAAVDPYVTRIDRNRFDNRARPLKRLP